MRCPKDIQVVIIEKRAATVRNSKYMKMKASECVKRGLRERERERERRVAWKRPELVPPALASSQQCLSANNHARVASEGRRERYYENREKGCRARERVTTVSREKGKNCEKVPAGRLSTGREDARLHDRLSLQHRASSEGGGSGRLLGTKEAREKCHWFIIKLITREGKNYNENACR